MDNDDNKIETNSTKKSFTVSKESGNNNSDGTWTVPRKSTSDPTPVEGSASLSRTRDGSRIPNIAFVLDLLEKATAHGTLTNAEAFSAFDQWLSDRTTPSREVVDSSCASRPSSDPIPDDTTSLHSMGLWNTNSVTTTVSSGDRLFTRSVSSAAAVPERTSVSDPTLNWREQSVCNRSHRQSKGSFMKGLSRLFAACGTHMATSPPGRDLPVPPVSLNRGILFERPLPKVPVGANNLNSHNSVSGIPIASSTVCSKEPIYAEYDAEYAHFTVGEFSSCPPTAEDADTDSIYDEADDTFLEESYDTLKSTSSLPFNVTEIEGLPKEVHRLDSGMGSSHSDIA